jgi:Uncharacterized protein related to capsule biosynthesis enzymes
MATENIVADVSIWGQTVGAVQWDDRRKIATFQFTENYQDLPFDLSPILLKKNSAVIEFPMHRNSDGFKGLPGLLSDSLPDKYGSGIIDTWVAKNGRKPLNPVEKLCYVGPRGMGALVYKPVINTDHPNELRDVNIDALVNLAQSIVKKRGEYREHLDPSGADTKGLEDLVAVGTSAGGARAKALLAWNKETGDIVSGQTMAPDGFTQYLFKFDVSGNKDKELEDPKGFGLIEYTYYQLATLSKIDMSDCELYRENNRAHFITKRFDRIDTDLGDDFNKYQSENDPRRKHMQSLCALYHADFNQPRTYGYEIAASVIKQLISEPTEQKKALEQQYRRMIFNVLARNHDDHTKNIAFLMDQYGRWSLSPAFDVTYSYNPAGQWTSAHQMTINGKSDGFTLDDLLKTANGFNIKKLKAKEIISEIQNALGAWDFLAEDNGIDESMVQGIRQNFRSYL